jgi:uncharacterized membrane protein YukC
MVLVDIKQCPYIIFTSYGVHKHLPPLLTKAPEHILQGIKDLILQIQDLSLTTGKYYTTNYELLANQLKHNFFKPLSLRHFASNIMLLH